MTDELMKEMNIIKDESIIELIIKLHKNKEYKLLDLIENFIKGHLENKG